MKFFFTLLLCCITTCLYANEQEKWLAFGDLRGHAESCGCDPATDLGGINRLHYFLTLESRINSPFLLFNLGNNLSTDKNKNKAIMSLLALLPLTASLLNERELLSFSLLKHKKNYVLSNQKTKLVENYITTGNSIIFGYLYNKKVKKHVLHFDAKIQNAWQKTLAQHAKKFRYLLYSGSLAHLQNILRAVRFDRVLLANLAAPAATATQQEKEKPALLLKTINKQRVFMSPLAGQGVLRGGEMMLQEVEVDFGKIMAKKDSKNNLLQAKRVTWLSKKYDHQAAKFWQQYLRDKQAEFSLLVKTAKEKFADTKYIGALTCQGCHLQEYRLWQKTKHAKAMQVLINKQRHKNADCVACHSVGFGKGGYISAALTPHLANVQCENCHGARKEHVLSAGKKKGQASSQQHCVRCHHPPHTAKFSLAHYWQKIKH